MKKIITTIIITGTLFTSCKKWLDVKPQAQTTRNELFSTEKGFRDALVGAYIDMKSGDIYGGSLIWGNIEFMARNWDPISTPTQAVPNLIAGNYNDATVRDWMDKTYAGLYKVIADVNGILDNIAARRSVFSDKNYELIKGESLALRAFCHFDALRLFGPLPSNPGAVPVLAYVKHVSNEITPHSTFAEFTQSILADLDSAENLLKTGDPILQYTIAELNPVENGTHDLLLEDSYLLYRQVRMNYYAVLALKARVYLWLSTQDDAQKENAARYARMVVDAKAPNGAPMFRLGVESDRVAGDYTMSPEHILGLSVHNLAAAANANFEEGGSLARYDFNIQDGYYYLNNLFPVNERTSDIRWTGMWSYKTTAGQSSFVKYRKYLQRGTNPILQIPLLRLSEMYLILTECATSKQEAETAYAAYCSKKGIPFTSGFNSSNWESDRRNKIIREYVREFYAEGQTFFTYKRFNLATLPGSWTYSYYSATPAKYIVPLPDRELNYNNK